MVSETGTYSLFDAIYPEYKSDKKVRLIEFFGGIGSQAKALERLNVDFEAYRLCEIDKFAVASYNAIHGTEFTTSDITQLHGEDMGVVRPDVYDYILTWSFPCGVEGTLVNTQRGLIEIENVVAGDQVLCHDGKWHTVTWSGKTGDKEVYSIRTLCCPETKFTPEHKFYVRKKSKNRVNRRQFSDPEWIELKDIQSDVKNYFCGLPVNQNAIIPEWDGIELNCGSHMEHRNSIGPVIHRPEFWWVVGKYVADGWHRSQGGVVISCGWDKDNQGDLTKTNQLLEKLDAIGIHATVADERTSHKVHITYKEWEEFLTPIDRGAQNKEIPQFILDLPVDLLQSFLDGYLAGDGHQDNVGRWNFNTSSEKLAYGLVQVVAKVYHVGCSCRPGNTRGGKCVIEGREVNYNPFWSLSFKVGTERTNAFYEDGFIWHPVKSVIVSGETLPVYDLTVEDAHSFVANNCIVHNCTSLSVAGLRNGMSEGSGTASSLIWEVRRILQEMKDLADKDASYGLPKILLMENVPQVVDAKNVGDLNKMRDFLESIGYSNHLAILKGNDYGVPQARHRAFMVSILGDDENPIYSYQFPVPCGCKWNMADCLYPDFPAKNLIRTSVAHAVCEENANFDRNTLFKLNEIKLCGRLNSHQAGGCFDPTGVSPTLTAGGASAINVLYRSPTDLEDSDDWNSLYWHGDGRECDITLPESSEEVADYLFDDSETEISYEKEPDYVWEPVVRDHVDFSLRTLTPKESLLLMDFDENDFNRATQVTSDHQIHRQSGNSIVVNCIVAILGQFFTGKENVYRDIAGVAPKERGLYGTGEKEERNS